MSNVRLRKLVDHRLIDADPVRHAHFGINQRFQLFQGILQRRHDRFPYFDALATRTMRLPLLSPASNPIRALGAFSSPSTISS